MENIFVEFLPPWVETGLQPAFYDKESGTVLQQTARMYARVNMLIRMFNKLSKNTKTVVEDYIDKFNQLHDYVYYYFDNLDVQEEINNKLDDMAEQGTLQEIVAAYLNSRAFFGYNTVADMKLAENLIDGSYAETMGYYTKNDGGGAKYKISSEEPSGYYEVLDSGLYAELVSLDNLNVKQFGAKGDGIHNDTDAIQNAVDYAFNHKTQVKVPASVAYYKVTMPILLRNKFTDNPISGYWFGEGTKLVGDNRGTSKIVKIGNNTYIESEDTFVNNKNATIICSNDSSTGVSIESLTICNFNTYDGTTATYTNGSYGIYGNVSRSTLKDLNVKAYKGIYWYGFSSLFDNIVINATEEAFYNTNGTSNTFRFIYAPKCNNPYFINSQYSTMLNCCADDCTGDIFNLRGIGLSLINCGTESRKAQHIIKVSDQYSHISINNFFMIRQTGDSDNNITLDDCSVVYFTANASIDIEGLGIAEMDELDTSSHNSSIFAASDSNRYVTTSLKNIRYIKNYNGSNNEPSKLWAGPINMNSHQRIATLTGEFNYIVGDNGVIIPFIGGSDGYDLSATEGGKVIADSSMLTSKRIWMDCKTKYTTENDTNVMYRGRHSMGDVQLFNDPLSNNALGISITEKLADGWRSRYIPIVLSGSTANRPTTNLYDGLMYFDTTLHKPVWYNNGNTTWYDANGTSV